MSVTIETQNAATVEITDAETVVVTDATREVIEVATVGPQGPSAAVGTLGDIPDVDTSAAVANSVLYYDAVSETWKGDDINTIITITDGGGF